MAVFEYLGVLISVIMGLGITHLATGASKLIQNRGTVRLYVPHLLWTLNVLIYILLVWWGMFWWSNFIEAVKVADGFQVGYFSTRHIGR